MVFQLYGIDYEGPLPEMEEDGDVHVPAIQQASQRMNMKTCV